MNFKYFKIGALIPLILILALIFQPISNLIEDFSKQYESLSTVVDYIDTLSTIGLITLFLTFINFIGWKWTVFKWLVDLPNLNGRYSGTLVSSYIDPLTHQKTLKNCVIEVKQTASAIHIFAYYADPVTGQVSSRSYTTSEQIIKEGNGFFLLYYIFTNEPDTLSVQLNNHDGTAKFKYYPDIKTLEGDYYNKRGNTGKIIVVLQQKKILGRF